MNTTLFLEGEVSTISLANVGNIDALEINIDDINEASDVKEVMEQLDAYYESAELDAVSDIKTFTVMNPEDIRHMALRYEDEEEKEVGLDSFMLVNERFAPVTEILEHANVGDLIYLRKTQGSSNWQMSMEVASKDEPLYFSYFDCTETPDQQDLLSEGYYDVLCDTILPQSFCTQDAQAVTDQYAIEPEIVYASLYTVKEDPLSGEKILQKMEIPGYYFLEKTRNIDE